jgi:hypothetical protein
MKSGQDGGEGHFKVRYNPFRAAHLISDLSIRLRLDLLEAKALPSGDVMLRYGYVQPKGLNSM